MTHLERRPLGLGPTAAATAPDHNPEARRTAAERVELAVGVEDQEHGAVRPAGVRRRLGTGALEPPTGGAS